MDFVKLFNEVARAAKPAHANFQEITDEEEPLKNTHIDSLDALLIGIFLCEIYGIPEEVGKNMKPTTIKEYREFMEANKTQEPESIEKALELIK